LTAFPSQLRVVVTFGANAARKIRAASQRSEAGSKNATGEAKQPLARVAFDSRIKLEIHGTGGEVWAASSVGWSLGADGRYPDRRTRSPSCTRTYGEHDLASQAVNSAR
jgi:hypothetical protein